MKDRLLISSLFIILDILLLTGLVTVSFKLMSQSGEYFVAGIVLFIAVIVFQATVAIPVVKKIIDRG